jgi:hypothetical protein
VAGERSAAGDQQATRFACSCNPSNALAAPANNVIIACEPHLSSQAPSLLTSPISPHKPSATSKVCLANKISTKQHLGGTNMGNMATCMHCTHWPYYLPQTMIAAERTEWKMWTGTGMGALDFCSKMCQCTYDSMFPPFALKLHLSISYMPGSCTLCRFMRCKYDSVAELLGPAAPLQSGQLCWQLRRPGSIDMST